MDLEKTITIINKKLDELLPLVIQKNKKAIEIYNKLYETKNKLIEKLKNKKIEDAKNSILSEIKALDKDEIIWACDLIKKFKK